jgi:DNA modification methylase
MPENSVDSIVTDPPYGLSFMNKEWDSFGTDTRQPGDEHYWVPDNPYGRSKARYGWNQDKSKLAASNRAFQESMTYVFEEALRVAKPGAHLLCFGGTRTFHRMACAIEDAGWEIRDCIMWVYGCLDEETEVLVDGEFVPYNKAKKGRLALGYDIGTGNFSWQRIEDTYLYDYDDTAYAIQSDCTDQLVSRNHRCIVERGGVEQFALAELVALEREASVPVLEGLHGLFDHLPLPDERAGGAQQDMLEGVRCGDSADTTEEAQGSRAEHDLSCMRQKVLRASCVAEESQDELLLGELQEQGGVRSKVDGVQHGTSNANVRGTEAVAQGANDWPTEPRMEGWGDVSPSQGQLREREVREVSSGISVDGSQGRVRDGASFGRGASNGQTAYSDGSCSSHQPRSVGQQAREPDAVPDEQGAQALRGAWGAKTTLARVMPVHYKGKMWCIKVATGAFVARRHGKIFVTGNSGFPKSMDVGKAIDKHLGKEREKVPNPLAGKQTAKSGTSSYGDFNGAAEITPEPASASAAQWDGWGTCLKPAWEPIIVARKPLDGTVAKNVLKWGVGALNIDACRVPTEDNLNGGAHSANSNRSSLHGDTRSIKGMGMFAPGKRCEEEYVQPSGRFPANLVHDGSQMVLDLFPDTGKSSGGVKAPGKNGIYGSYSGHEYPQQLGLGDSGSAARFFYCAKASKKDRGDGNNHPTVKPTELMKWLVQLVTPEGGVVLDPFAGSGTTLVACKMLGRDCIGIEREQEYVEIIKRRLGE